MCSKKSIASVAALKRILPLLRQDRIIARPICHSERRKNWQSFTNVKIPLNFFYFKTNAKMEKTSITQSMGEISFLFPVKNLMTVQLKKPQISP